LYQASIKANIMISLNIQQNCSLCILWNDEDACCIMGSYYIFLCRKYQCCILSSQF